VSRRDDQRLEDILAAATAVSDHLRRGTLDDGMVFDAVRVRLIEIGEAVRAIAPDVLALEPDIAWVDVAGMRIHLAHRYFDTAHAIVQPRSITICRRSSRLSKGFSSIEARPTGRDCVPNRVSCRRTAQRLTQRKPMWLIPVSTICGRRAAGR